MKYLLIDYYLEKQNPIIFFLFIYQLKSLYFISFICVILFEVLPMMQGIQFIGTMKVQRFTNNYGFIISNNEGYIDGISQSFFKKI